jgi:hypothetical protein
MKSCCRNGSQLAWLPESLFSRVSLGQNTPGAQLISRQQEGNRQAEQKANRQIDWQYPDQKNSP